MLPRILIYTSLQGSSTFVGIGGVSLDFIKVVSGLGKVIGLIGAAVIGSYCCLVADTDIYYSYMKFKSNNTLVA